MAPRPCSGSSLKYSLNLHIKIDIPLTKHNALALCGLWRLAHAQLEFCPFSQYALGGWLTLHLLLLTLESCHEF